MGYLDTIDDMPNITLNFSNKVYDHVEDISERILVELFTVVCILSVIANILLIIVIVKYNKLKEDPTNVIFLNVNVLQAVDLLATKLALRMASAFLHISPIHETAFCVLYQVEYNMGFGISCFQLLLICDWYLSLYHENAYVKFRRVYKFFIIVLYIVIVLGCSVTVHYCFGDARLLVTYYFAIIGLYVPVIFLIIMNVIHAVKKRNVLVKENIGLAVANIFFLFWSPALLVVLIGLVGFTFPAPHFVVFVVILGWSSPIYTSIYLFVYDHQYNACMKQLFRCNQRDHVENEAVSYNNASGVAISET